MRRIALIGLSAALAGLLSLAFVEVADAGAVAIALRAPVLNGANEFPGPGDSDGTGSATVYLDSATGIVCWAIVAENIALPIVADHIHLGDAGAAGPIVINFAASFNGCTSGVSGTLIEEIAADPAGYYVNLHNAAFPAGAIRGQLEVAELDPVDMTAAMDADQEVPSVDSPATGDAELTVDPNGLVCWDFSATDLSSPVILAHIHSGAVGVAGDIVVDLRYDLFGADGGCVVAEADIAADILADPELFYFNVHTEDFRTGEIRGQLEEVVEPTTTTTTTTSVPGAVTPIATRAPAAQPATAVTSTPNVTG
jgi:hypothetical protein